MRALLRSPFARALEVWLFAVVPLFVAIETTRGSIRTDKIAFDFDRAYYHAAKLLLHGASPYGPSTREALNSQTAFVYPPISAYLTTPFALLPHLPADLVVTVLATVSVPALLALVGVRDWRVMGAALLWWPTITAIHLGSVSIPLALGIAAAWRWRDRPVPSGLIIGLVVALKLFLWPLVIWFAITRRWKAAGIAACSSIVFVLAPWIPLGGAGLLSYPHRLGLLSSLEAKRGFSPADLLAGLGANWTTAQVIGYGLGLAMLVWASRRRDAEAKALALVLAASLLLSPILWPNYIVVLLVPLALVRPRLDVWWLVPIALFSQPYIDPATWQIAFFLGTFAALVVAIMRTGEPITVEGRSPAQILKPAPALRPSTD